MVFPRPDKGAPGRAQLLWTWLGDPSWIPNPWMCLSWSQSPSTLSPNPGKKRVWIPDEQDAYVEAEVKSEATGGRVNVETKDQKVWLPLFLGVAPLPLTPVHVCQVRSV